MAPVNGRPFLEHLLDYWIGQGITGFVMSVGYMHDAITGHFGASYRGCEIRYSVEPAPLGTGGAVLLSAQARGGDGPFLLLNGDTYFTVELASLKDFARRNDADWCFSLYRSSDVTRYMGLSVDADGRVDALRTSQSSLINGGVYWINPRNWPLQPFRAGMAFSLENDYLPAALSDGQRLFGMESTGTFLDIGLPADYARATACLPSSQHWTARTLK